MSKIIQITTGMLAALIVAGCSTTPSTAIRQPLSARPQATAPAQQADNSGAIFQARQGLALFEDRRARQIGDTLMVRLIEKTEAKRKSETKENRAANANINVPAPKVAGINAGIGATSWEPTSTSNQNFKDDETNTNSFTGSIAVTVVDVLENGNLLVAGEKQVAVNNDTEYIRLAGVVNPRDISRDGSVNSTQIADARIESKNAQSIDKSQVTSMMARFFLTVLPF